jgi:hypothetical protein
MYPTKLMPDKPMNPLNQFGRALTPSMPNRSPPELPIKWMRLRSIWFDLHMR